MKNTKLLLMLLLICSPILVAKTVKKKPVANPPLSWAETVSKVKSELGAKQKALGFPIESAEISKGKIQSISANVTNLDYIVLTIDSKVPGRTCNDAIWANARLTANDGSTVKVSDLPIRGYSSLILNVHRHEVKINNQKIENSILSSEWGYIYVPLDKKYTRFDSEIGVDDEGNDNPAIFRIQSESGEAEFKSITEKFPDECYAFFPQFPYAGQRWITASNNNHDNVILTDLISRLKNKNYYSGLQQNISNLESNKQTLAGLNLFLDVFSVLKLQEQLEWLNVDAIAMAHKHMQQSTSYPTENNQLKLDSLKQIVSKGFDGIYSNKTQCIQDAHKALSLKKDILFSNSLLDIDKILVGRYKVGFNARSVNISALGTEPANWACLMSSGRKGFDAELAHLTNLRRNLKINTIFKSENRSSLPHIVQHWNADRIMFTMANADGLWQVYEVDADGKNLRKVIKSEEPDLEFFDACYLPNGKIMAVSNIGYLGVPCVDGEDIVGNTILYNPADQNIRRITFDQESNWGPIVMNNGRVMFTRWEYTDLTHYYSRIVMHMNPDGTEQKALYGSGSYFPNSTFDIKPLPGHGIRFVGVISGHHGTVRSGRMMIFDPAISRKNAEGITHEFPYRNRKVEPIIKDELVDGVWPQFVKPYPLDENYYLVTAKLNPQGLWGLYLVDTFDNLTLIKEAEGEGYIHGTPVRKTVIPPVIPEKVK